jgi:hypothetical protein
MEDMREPNLDQILLLEKVQKLIRGWSDVTVALKWVTYEYGEQRCELLAEITCPTGRVVQRRYLRALDAE